MIKIAIPMTTEMIKTCNNDKEVKIMKLLHPKLARLAEMPRPHTPNLIVRDKFQPKSGDLKLKFTTKLQSQEI